MVSCFKRTFILSLFSLAMSCGQNGDAPGLLSSDGALGLRIFVTDATVPYNFGGAAAADTICNTQASSRGLSGTYKAIVVDNTRGACTTPNCSGGVSENNNWVLHPSTTYYREDGQTLFATTTASGIFTYPTTNSLSDTGTIFFTGLRTDWTNDGLTCTNWTATTGVTSGRMGFSTNTSNVFNDPGSTACSSGNEALACAEQ